MSPARLPVPYRCPRCGAVQALHDRGPQVQEWCHHCQCPMRHTRVRKALARTAQAWPPAARRQEDEA